jgi:thioredoxin reductase (NADPH)
MILTILGSGCVAALEAERYIAETEASEDIPPPHANPAL